MGSRTLIVSASFTRWTKTHSYWENIHYFFDRIGSHLRKIHDVDFLFAILSAEDYISVVQQVVQLPTVDLVERQVQLQVGIHVQEPNHIVRCKQVQPRYCSITRSHHRKGLSTSCLTIGKACRFRAFESFSDKWKDAFLVDDLVVSLMSIRIVKLENVLLNVLRQINFQPK